MVTVRKWRKNDSVSDSMAQMILSLSIAEWPVFVNGQPYFVLVDLVKPGRFFTRLLDGISSLILFLWILLSLVDFLIN